MSQDDSPSIDDVERAAAYKEDTDDAYRAIGRFVYEFGRLMWHMKWNMARLSLPDVTPPLIVMEQMTAAPIRDGFFGLCRYFGELTDEELKIEAAFRNRVTKVIEQRNAFAHAHWLVGWGTSDSVRPDHPQFSKAKARRDGTAWETRVVPVAELDSISDAIAEWRPWLMEFGRICMSDPTSDPDLRVGDVYTVSKKGVLARNGVKAQGQVFAP